MSWQNVSWQVGVRAVIVAVSSLAIVAVGGPAAVQQLHRVGAAALARPVAMTASARPTERPQLTVRPHPLVRAATVDRGLAPVVVTATSLKLTLVPPLTRSGTKARAVLRGTLLKAGSKAPVSGRVTLWRRTRSGRWTAVLADRPTSPEGVVEFVVAQSGRSAVYRLTFLAQAPYLASTSGNLTVRRR